jgi:hypothetical protein
MNPIIPAIVAAAIGYLCLAIVFAGFATRWLADAYTYCTTRPGFHNETCAERHPAGCWRATGEITPLILAWGVGAGLLWPLSIIPCAACMIAIRRPSPVLDTNRIAELERDLGIKDGMNVGDKS